MLNLDKELAFDAIMNFRRIQHFTDLYTLDDGFFVGRLMFEIRAKFTRMIRLYMLSYNNFDAYDHNKHVLHLMEIQHLAMEIDNLVEIIFDYAWPKKKRRNPIEKFLPPGMTLPPDVQLPPGLAGVRSGRESKTPKVLFESNHKNLDQAVVIQNIGGKSLVDWRNAENNGGDFDSDVN
ncbi:unnamed protein product [Leptosia nina]|uniref:Uncharacterized protein n=1 Tax=Leptosia nina TaxID=320188 RepID=A0AAV1K1D8_9NEOP